MSLSLAVLGTGVGGGSMLASSGNAVEGVMASLYG